MAADSRTSASVDYVAAVRKLKTFEAPSVEEGDRHFAALRRRYGEGLTRLFDRLPGPDIEGL